MLSLRKLAIVSVLTALVAPFVSAGETLKLLCIGDSITQGRLGNETHKRTFGYRYELWKQLVDAGVAVDMLGSHDVGFNGTPPYPDYKEMAFDNDHEGHWGWTTVTIAKQLPDWLDGYAAPGMATIMLGTNDKPQDKKVAMVDKAMRSIVSSLRERNPDVVVFLGLAFQEWKPFPELRDAMRALAAELSTEQSPIITVDHSEGWVSKPDRAGTHTIDWVHPNEAGDRLIAERFFSAMKPYLTAHGAR